MTTHTALSLRLASLAEARDLLARSGTDGLTYLCLRDGARALTRGEAAMAFFRCGGGAIAVGAPSGPAYDAFPLLHDFLDLSRREDWRPAFCGLPGPYAEHVAGLGFRLASVGDEAIVELSAIDLRGKRWREARAAMNRARRRGITFRWLSAGERFARLDELTAVSRDWLAAKHLPELRFAFGNADSLADPAVCLGTAIGPDSELLGFVTWTPAPVRSEWMLDLLRNRPNVMAGLNDFLITSSLLSFKAEGLDRASLSGTPFAGSPVGWGPLRARDLAKPFRSLYDYDGLLHFKAKFNPVWRKRYLAYEGRLGLPATLLHIARLSMPSAIAMALIPPVVLAAWALGG
ncbi:MAG: DUF2156 domain-containing protein [Chloroflexi bacterium]|nr:DUF2156 domain-containing protein [Chloroflexota bacterium]